MLIRSTSPNEPEGRKVEIDGIEYHFAPNAEGNCVCDVTEKAHVSRFLSIPEGYEIHDPSLKDTVRPTKAFETPQPTPDPLAGTEQVEEVTDADVEAADKAEKEPVEPKGPDYNGMTRKQLEAAYEQKFGRKPHPRAKDDTLLSMMVDD